MTTGGSLSTRTRRRLSVSELLFVTLLTSVAAAAVALEIASGGIWWPGFLGGLALLALAILRPLLKTAGSNRSWLDAAVLVVVVAATHLLVASSGGGESALYAFYFLPILASAREYGLRGAVLVGLGVCGLYATFFIGSSFAEIEAELFEEIITLLFTTLLSGYLFEQIGAEQEARRQAQDARRLADIGLLASQVAHEIRNPLQVIEGAAETIDARGWIAPEGRPFLEDLRRESRRMARVAGDFLAWGRPAIRASETLPLRTICERAHHRAGGAPTLSLLGEIDRAIRADEDAMERAFANLMQNAAQAGASTMTITASAHPTTLEILVSDDGKGIPDALRVELFEPFRSGRQGGTGLGLAIVHGILTGHGGTITLSPSARTTFCILIPLASSPGGTPS